jgi:hypothetical protein
MVDTKKHFQLWDFTNQKCMINYSLDLSFKWTWTWSFRKILLHFILLTINKEWII